MVHRLCADSPSHKTAEQLLRFYQGKNIFKFFRLWERVFSYLLIKSEYCSAETLLSRIKKETLKITFNKNTPVIKQLQNNLNHYLNLSIEFPLALRAKTSQNLALYRSINSNLCPESDNLRADIRTSNLTRHHYIAFPLVNYTNYDGDYIDLDLSFIKTNSELQKTKVDLSPRYIHYDECQIFCWTKSFYSTNSVPPKPDLYEHHSCFINGEAITTCPLKRFRRKRQAEKQNSEEVNNIILSHISVGEEKAPVDIKVGVANLKINQEDYENNLPPKSNQNLSFTRQNELFELVTDAQKNKCDLLVLPELAVPYTWIPFMIAHSRRAEIGMVFGIEHLVVDDNAFNLIVTILPYTNNKYKSAYLSLRLKNNYAPQEIESLKKLRLEKPQTEKQGYELFKWKGVNFSVYNCFELSNINHRAAMLSKIDFMIASVYNKDITYFSNIIESTARDLHCFVVQVNSSNFGDSRIVQPTSRHSMNLLQVSGGENTTLLAAKLPIKKLRLEQFEEFTSGHINHFKPTPPGFDKKNERLTKPLNRHGEHQVKKV